MAKEKYLENVALSFCTHRFSYNQSDKYRFYNAFAGQRTGAVKLDSENTQLADLSYLYDHIGNRTGATENSTTTTYASNPVNQYTQVASQVPTYDADGNMLTYDGWTYAWNGENRLVAAVKENSNTRLEFDYDYMGRRLFKKVYENDTLTSHRKFAYDGYKLIAEFDALNNDAPIASYLWQPTGLDVPLMRNSEYYVTDGNKNVIELRNVSGAVTTSYSYDPFGNLPLPMEDNYFGFSSEYYDGETRLVYYNYRYYSPELGRWISRDPIGEEGGVNLYGMCKNNIITCYDAIGLLFIDRKGAKYAIVCFPNENSDNISKLAKEINLSIGEKDYWLSDEFGNRVGSPKANQKYRIPNTVIAYWAGDLDGVGKWWVDWNKNISFFTDAGYYVNEIRYSGNEPSGHYATILNSSSSDASLYGTYFWGHGNELGVGTRHKHLAEFKMLNIKYTIAFAHIYACDSNKGKGQFKAKEWTGFDGKLVPWNPWDPDWKNPSRKEE